MKIEIKFLKKNKIEKFKLLAFVFMVYFFFITFEPVVHGLIHDHEHEDVSTCVLFVFDKTSSDQFSNSLYLKFLALILFGNFIVPVSYCFLRFFSHIALRAPPYLSSF